eukprot:11760614-Alexandrium_andersonii.AAC.1
MDTSETPDTAEPSEREESPQKRKAGGGGEASKAGEQTWWGYTQSEWDQWKTEQQDRWDRADTRYAEQQVTTKELD